ncbi:MAG: methionine aminotransferase [Chitinophagaceae bacterium]|jgi:methionine aminotransferase
MPTINSKLPATGTSIFTVMSALASQHGAINLGQGFPDFHMDAELAERAAKAIVDGHNQYVPMAGYLPLRESIAHKISSLYSTAVAASDEITITPGGTYAIYTAFTAILEPGDEVIVMEPAYDSYVPNIIANGGRPVCIPLIFPDYRVDWDAVRSSITPKTKAIIVNSPHNPTGSVLSHEDLLTLENMLRDTNIFLISDEVYEHLVFDGKKHNSVLNYPELFNRSFVCFSFGKVYNCTGWKLGYCVAPKALTAEFRKIHQFNAFCCFTPTQIALAEHLRNPEPYLRLGGFMQQKRDVFLNAMKGSGFDMLSSFGSYFVCGTYSRISNKPAMELAVELTETIGVATIPVSAFYVDGHDDRVLRFCFAKKEETLLEAARRLQSIG